MQNKRVGVSTLGCKVNRFESELVSESLGKSGWSVVGDREEADLYIINTCTVTREADRQARQAVRRAIRRNPSAVVVVTGCYAQISPDAVAGIPGVDHVIGNDRKLDLDKLLPDLGKRQVPNIMVGDLDRHVSLPDRLLEGYENQTRAFVQIQQGCNQGCTFCIIHRARGPSRSLPPTLVKRQVERLALAGFREIVICGVDLGSYGEDLESDAAGSFSLAKLLTEICNIDQDFRVRLSSIDPGASQQRTDCPAGRSSEALPSSPPVAAERQHADIETYEAPLRRGARIRTHHPTETRGAGSGPER